MAVILVNSLFCLTLIFWIQLFQNRKSRARDKRWEINKKDFVDLLPHSYQSRESRLGFFCKSSGIACDFLWSPTSIKYNGSLSLSLSLVYSHKGSKQKETITHNGTTFSLSPVRKLSFPNVLMGLFPLSRHLYMFITVTG